MSEEDVRHLLSLTDEVPELERCLRCLKSYERDPSTLALARAILEKPAPTGGISCWLRCVYREWRVVSEPSDREAKLKQGGKWGRCRPRVGDFVETNWDATDEIAAVGKVQKVKDDRCVLDHIGVVGRDRVRAELSSVRLCSPEFVFESRERVLRAFAMAVSKNAVSSSPGPSPSFEKVLLCDVEPVATEEEEEEKKEVPRIEEPHVAVAEKRQCRIRREYPRRESRESPHRIVEEEIDTEERKSNSFLETRQRFLPPAPTVFEPHQNKSSGAAVCRADAEERRRRRIERCKANGEYYEEMTDGEKTRFFSQQAKSNHRRAQPEKFLTASEKHAFLAFKCFLDKGDYANATKIIEGLDEDKYKPWKLLLRTRRQAEANRPSSPAKIEAAQREVEDEDDDDGDEWEEEYETESEEPCDDTGVLCSVVLRDNEYLLKEECVLELGLDGALSEFDDPLLRQALRRTAIQVCRERKSGAGDSKRRDAQVTISASPKGSYAVLLVEECERRPPPKEEDLERAREIVDLVLYKKGTVTLRTVEEVLAKDREFGRYAKSLEKAYTKKKETELDDVAIAELLREDKIPVTTWEVGRKQKSFLVPPPLGFLPLREWSGAVNNMLVLPEWTLVIQVWSGDFIRVCHGEVRMSCASFLEQQQQQQSDTQVCHPLKPRREATSLERKRAERASLTLKIDMPREDLKKSLEAIVLGADQQQDYDTISAVSSPDF